MPSRPSPARPESTQSGSWPRPVAPSRGLGWPSLSQSWPKISQSPLSQRVLVWPWGGGGAWGGAREPSGPPHSRLVRGGGQGVRGGEVKGGAHKGSGSHLGRARTLLVRFLAQPGCSWSAKPLPVMGPNLPAHATLPSPSRVPLQVLVMVVAGATLASLLARTQGRRAGREGGRGEVKRQPARGGVAFPARPELSRSRSWPGLVAPGRGPDWPSLSPLWAETCWPTLTQPPLFRSPVRSGSRLGL